MTTHSDFILRGKKVLLRPFTLSDVDEAYIAWLNDQDVVRFSNQRFLNHDRESCLRYLASFENTDNLFISVRRLHDDCRGGSQIGTMTAYVAKHHGTVDVGIMIGDKTLWGTGSGQDAWDTLTNWLIDRDDIRKLTAGTLACNTGMIKLMERSCMQHEATRKAQELIENEPVDIFYFSKFCDEKINKQ
ncbi:MAG: GNAT family protein [Gammaproteobacteria bacterium]|nr:GNAT family protein [Gammaproteobacteria bacterium]